MATLCELNTSTSITIQINVSTRMVQFTVINFNKRYYIHSERATSEYMRLLRAKEPID